MNSQQRAILEENLLAILVFRPECNQFLVKLNGFQWANQNHDLIAKTAQQFIEQYHNPPGPHIRDILTHTPSGTKGQLLDSTINEIEKKAPNVNLDYIQEEFDEFILRSEAEKKLQLALEQLEQGDKLTDILNGVSQISSSSQTQGGFLCLNDPAAHRDITELDDTEKFTTGVEALDDLGIYLRRGEILVILGATSSGKSWGLVEIGKQLTRRYGARILHITFELNEKQTRNRLLQSIFGRMDRNFKQTNFLEVPTWEGKVEITPRYIQDLTHEQLGYFYPSPKLQSQKPRFQYDIQHFPAKSLDIAGLKSYLNQKKQLGTQYDHLIIDHCDDLLIDAENFRIDSGIMYKELRGIASSYNLSVYTATQVNRLGMQAKRISLVHMSEDITKAFTSDIVLALAKTKTEDAQGRARISVLKGRNVQKAECEIIQCYALGQFALHSRLYQPVAEDDE